MHCIAHYSSGPPGVQTPSVRNSLERPDRPTTSADGTPVLGFEPRSEAPQASRIIQCSEGGACRLRSYPTRAPVDSIELLGPERAVPPNKLEPTGLRRPRRPL